MSLRKKQENIIISILKASSRLPERQSKKVKKRFCKVKESCLVTNREKKKRKKLCNNTTSSSSAAMHMISFFRVEEEE